MVKFKSFFMGVITKIGYFDGVNRILTKTNWGKIWKQAQVITLLKFLV